MAPGTASNQETLVTVFGGSGFLGRHVVRALARRDYRIRVAVRRPELAGHLQPLGMVGWVQPVQANVRYRWSVDRAVEGADHEEASAKSSLNAVLVQLLVINLVFSLDSVITAIGMTEILAVMVAAVVLSTLVMAVAADPLGGFIERHPTTKMLALSFILLVGVALVADGLGFHIPRGYLYFAIAFSLFVELLNIRARNKPKAAH